MADENKLLPRNKIINDYSIYKKYVLKITYQFKVEIITSKKILYYKSR